MVNKIYFGFIVVLVLLVSACTAQEDISEKASGNDATEFAEGASLSLSASLIQRAEWDAGAQRMTVSGVAGRRDRSVTLFNSVSNANLSSTSVRSSQSWRIRITYRQDNLVPCSVRAETTSVQATMAVSNAPVNCSGSVVVPVVTNRPPVAQIVSPLADVVIAVGGQVSFDGSASDPDGTTQFSYLWNFAGVSPNSVSRTPGRITFSQAGTYRISFTAFDDKGSASNTVERVVTVNAAVVSPVVPQVSSFSPATDVTINVNEAVTFNAAATDPSGDTLLSYHWNFDGGAPDSLAQNPGQVTFVRAGVYRVRLMVTNNAGYAVVVSKTVTVTGQSILNTAPNGTIVQPASNVTIQVGDSLSFRANGVDPNGDVISYLWNFDGVAPNATGINPAAVTFNNTGVYNIQLTASDSNGLKDPTPAIVTVTVANAANRNQAPDSYILTPSIDLIINRGDSIDFRGAGFDPEGQPVTYLWDMGGAAPNSNLQSPGRITFNTAGVFQIRMTARDAAGLVDATPAIRTVTVRDLNTTLGAPNGLIVSPATDMVINQGDTLALIGMVENGASGSPFSYLWNLDGAAPNSTSQNPGNYIFNTPGIYRISLSVSNSFGIQDPTPAQRTITVKANSTNGNNLPPDGVITFPASDVVIGVGTTLFISGRGIDPENAGNVQCRWSYDGALPNSNACTPGNVTFNRVGTFRVRLTVTDTQGASDPTPAERTISVASVASSNLPPVATITSPLQDMSVKVGDTLYLSGSATDPDNNLPIRYMWDLDGAMPSVLGATPGNITFTQEGTYRIRLIVSDAKGLSNVNPPVRTITVGPAVVVSNRAPNGQIISPVSDQVIDAGSSLLFNATASDPDGDTQLTYRWNFDGVRPNSIEQQPGNVVFNTPGTYHITLTVTDSKGLSDATPDVVMVTVRNSVPLPNRAPNGQIVQPASTMSIFLGESVFFTGTGTDPDGDALTYRWSFGAGIADSTQSSPGYVRFNQTGYFNVQLTVTDSKGLSDPTPATVAVSVIGITPANAAPDSVIDAPAQTVTVNAGSPLYFSGHGVDPDGDVNLTYSWVFGGGVAPSSLATPGAVVFNTPGTYAVRFTVTDSKGLSDATPAVRTVIVANAGNNNAAPNGQIVAPTASSVSINVGETVFFAATGNDPDNNTPLIYYWNFDGGASSLLTQNPGTVRFHRAGHYRVTMVVTDALGASDATPAQVLVTVRDPAANNTAPESRILSPSSSRTISVGDTISFDGAGTDADGDTPFTYMWNFDGAAPNSTAKTPGNVKFFNEGTYRITFTVTDSRGASDVSPAEVVITVANPQQQNQAPNSVIVSPSNDMVVYAGDSIMFTGTGYDLDGNIPLSHRWRFNGAAQDQTVASPGLLVMNTPGVYNVTYTVTDSAGLVDPTPATRRITVLGISTDSFSPSAFITSPASDLTIAEGQSVTFAGYATDPDNDVPFVYLWNFDGAAPNSLLANPGSITFTQAGTYRVKFSVTDADGLQDPTPPYRTITVVGANQPASNQAPDGRISFPLSDMTIKAGEPVYFSATATDPENDTPFTYRWDFDSAVANVIGQTPGNVTFNRVGSYRVRLTVTDSRGASDPVPAERVITVQGANSTNAAPTAIMLTPSGDQVIEVGSAVNFSGSGTDPDGNLPLKFFWSFDNAVPNVVGATPGNVTFLKEGVYTVTLKVADSLGLISQNTVQRTITVRPVSNIPPGQNQEPVPQILNPSGNVTINQGQAINFQAGGYDPDGNEPLRYIWVLPTVFSSQANPSYIFNQVGTYVISLYAQDSLNLMSSTPAQVTVTVRGNVITTNNAPNGFINTPTTDMMISAGGRVNFSGSGIDPDGDAITYRWNFAGAAPNSVLQSPGYITFSTKGIYSVTLTVKDQNGLEDPTPATRTIIVN